MPVRSIVQIRCWSLSLASVAAWLSAHQWASLFRPEGDPERRRQAQIVAATLQAAATRKRRGYIATVNLPRDQAEWLASIRSPRGLFGAPSNVPGCVSELASLCRLKTGSSSRGRRRLDRLAIEARVSGRVAVNDRHRKRLRRRLREDKPPPLSLSLFDAK